jgi:MFS family permease
MTPDSGMREPAPRSGRHARADAPSYRWWLLLVTSLGALLASLTSGTLVIALPDILRDLHTDLFALLWIVVGYTLVVTVFVLNAGRLADMFERTRTYTLGLVVFTAASAFCAIAPDPLTLILGRVVQGLGGAFMFANSSALVTDVFPRSELGRALGLNAMVVGAGLILGPILGGWLTGFGWRFVFWFNVPLGIIGIVAALAILVERTPAQRSISIDWLGSARRSTSSRSSRS